jgi:chorismate-pyruvate lyase
MAPHFIRKKYNNIDLKKLTPFQRIILTTNGTLTNVIEAVFLERMKLVKLSEKTRMVDDSEAGGPMRLKIGETLIERVILLQGEETERNYLYAKSFIVVDRLDEDTRHDLLEKHIPIGQIWNDRQIELNKRFIEYSLEQAGVYSKYFKIRREDILFQRTYLVYTNRKPVFMISEHFPDLHPQKYAEREAIQVMRTVSHPKDEVKEMV